MCQLPSTDAQRDDIAAYEQHRRTQYVHSRRYNIQVDAIDYADEIANEIGARPQLAHIMLTDPYLATRMFIGANYPYVYRLTGPHRWPHAARTLLTANERVRIALRQRDCGTVC
jgi:dimethylaniline monooxygenase (N-oxide forming)